MAALCMATGSSHAQTESDDSDWQMVVRPYFFLSGVSGSVTSARETFPINSSFSELMDNLRPSGFVAFTAERGSWGGYADLQYISLIGEATNAPGTSLELRNFIVEADLTYRPAQAPSLRFHAGLRTYSVDQTLNIASQSAVESNTTVVDPIVGAVGVWTLTPSWSFEIRGDIGGFGLGSEFTNQLMGLLTWRMGNTLSLPFGYRVLDYQIKTGDVMMDIQMGGPVLGLEIRI
jgi:hypothetical protein